MSEPADSKEPEPVRIPAQPPMDMRADIQPLNEDSPIQGKNFGWNEKPDVEPPDSTTDPEPDEQPKDDE